VRKTGFPVPQRARQSPEGKACRATPQSLRWSRSQRREGLSSPRRNSHARETCLRCRSPSSGDAGPKAAPGSHAISGSTGPDTPKCASRPESRDPETPAHRAPPLQRICVVPQVSLEVGKFDTFWPFFGHDLRTNQGSPLGFHAPSMRHICLSCHFSTVCAASCKAPKACGCARRRVRKFGAQKRTAPKPAPPKSVLETEKTLTF